MSLDLPIRMGIQGSGQVVLKHVYPAVKELEKENLIRTTCIIEKGNLEERIKNLEDRAEEYPLEKESCLDIASRLKNNSIRYIECNGKGLPTDLKDDVDFVYIATPTNIRFEPIKQLAEMKIPFIVEKPIGLSAEDINKTAHLTEKIGVKGICSDHYSQKGPVLELIKNLDEKISYFKRIKSIEAVLEEPDFLEADRNKWLFDPSINGGGVWIDTGVHLMCLTYMIGAKMTDVISAKSYKYPFQNGDKRNEFLKSETAADVRFNIIGERNRIAPGASAHIKVAKCMPESKKYFKIMFEKGEILLDFDKNSICYTDKNNCNPTYKEEVLPKTKPYNNLIHAFVDYINNGKIPLTTIPQVKESTDAVFRIYSNMKEGDSRRYYKNG